MFVGRSWGTFKLAASGRVAALLGWLLLVRPGLSEAFAQGQFPPHSPPDMDDMNMNVEWKRPYCFVLVVLMLALSVQPGMAEEDDESPAYPKFGGPSSAPNQLEDDWKGGEALLGHSRPDRYLEWKDRLREKHGFSFTLDYTAGVLGASKTLGEEDLGAGGAVRFFSSWDMVGRESGNTGTFVLKVEHRHKYTDIPVSGIAGEVGYVGLVLPVLSDIGGRLTNLYWKQDLNQGRVEILAGFLDSTDWVDLFILAPPWTGFYNFALATGSASIPVPDDGALGINVNAMLTDNLYIIGGLADSNADSTDPFNGFDTFGEHEFFKSLELGWTTSHERFYLDNTHLTYWHADERENAGVSSGWGLNFSWSHSFGENKWLPFLRGGYASDGGSLLQKTVSSGVGYQLDDGKSLIGLGVNWGEPNEDTFGPGLRDQSAIELFSRFQITEYFQITPDIQLIMDPAKNPDVDQSWVYGIRARLIF